MIVAHCVGSALLVFLSWQLVRRASDPLRLYQPTPIGIAYLALVVVHYVPALAFLNDPAIQSAPQFVWACAVSLLALAAGALAINALTGFRVRENRIFFEELSRGPITAGDRAFLVFYGVACVGLFCLYMVEVPSYPLLALIKGSVSNIEINQMRRDVGSQDMGSPFWYLFGVGRAFLMPLAFALVVSSWRRLKGPGERLPAAVLILLVLIYNSWAGAKTPVAMLFAIGGLVVLINSNAYGIGEVLQTPRARRLSRRALITTAVFVVAVVSYPIFIFKFKTFGIERSTLEIFYEGVLKRVFFTPAFVAAFQFEMFPEIVDFTYFRDVHKLAVLMDWSYVDLSRLVSGVLFNRPDSHSPPAAIGNFYSQAGWPMIFLGFLFGGMLFQGVQVWIVRTSPRAPVVGAILATLCYGAFRVSMANFHTVLLTEGVVPAIGIFCTWRFVRGFAKEGKRRLETGSTRGMPTAKRSYLRSSWN